MEIRLLGPIEADLDSGPAPLGPRQQRAVLAMLALPPNRTVSTDQLIEGLWGEQAPRSAPKLVQLYISQLRRLLGAEAEIVTRGRGYELRLAAENVDAACFEGLVAEAANADGQAAELAREALALWRGAALADVADEPFAGAEIRRLEELRLRATELAIHGDLAAGRHRELIGELDALVAAHPLSEQLHAQRMLALYRSGRQAEALAAYRHARRVLVEEIGVEPGPELRRLHEAILRQDQAVLDLPAAVPPPAAAPPSVAREPRARSPVAGPRGGRVLAVLAALALLGGIAIFVESHGTGTVSLARIDENHVGKIDPETGGISEEYPVGRGASAVAAGGGAIWAINALDRTVSRIDSHREAVVEIAAGKDPAGLAFAGGSLWVTDRQSRTVSQISPAAHRIVHRIPVGNAPGAIAAGFGALWIASAIDRTVTRVDLGTGTVKKIDLGSRPTAIATGARAVWVASEEGGSVFRIEPGSGTVAAPIGVGHRPIGVAVGEGAVWVADGQDATVWRIDPEHDAVTDTTPVGRAPSAIASGAGGVWVARSGDGTVARIDPETRRVAETIRVHNSPSAIAVAEGSVWTAVLAAPASHRGGTLRVESQPFFEDHLEPEDIYGPLSLVYDGLLAYRRAGGPGFGTLVGDLATDVPKPGPDGTTYVFKLRPGIRYSNGAPVRPEDFRASLEATFRRLPALSVFRRIRGAPGCSKAPSRCDLSSGIVTDAHAHTITLRLTSPDPDLLPFLAHPLGYVVPAGQTFGSATGPAGTGPYRVASFDRKRGARLVRNRYFRVWSPDARPAGFADEIAIRPGKDVSAQVAAVEHGQADVVEIATAFGVGLPPARLRALETRSAGQLHTSPAPELDFMWLNTRTPPFDDARVRRALNYAVDRRAITRIAGGPGLAQPTCQYLPPGFPNYAPSCRYTRHPGSGGAWSGPDIAQARRLIEQSGTRGMAVTVWVYKEKRGYGRYFARLLHTLGYRASLRVLPEYEGYHMHVGDSRTRAQIGIDGWSADDEAPSAFTAPFVCSSFVPRSRLSLNPAEFCDRSLDARIETARAAGGTQANALWRGVYGGLAEAAPAVPLVNRRTMTLVSARVGNYQHHPLWSTLLDQLWVR